MSSQLRIILAQLDFLVGAVAANTQKIIATIQQARDVLKSDIVLFPELTLSGYLAEDLFLRSDFLQQIDNAVQNICQHVTGIDVVIGYPQRTPEGLYNAASVIRDKKIIATHYKQCLPNYDEFDEERYFKAGTSATIFTSKNTKIAVMICEDLWYPEPIAQAAQAGAQLILSPNASPFDSHKVDDREKNLRKRVKEQAIPIVYVNQICGQDDLIFAGGSLAMDAHGKICAQAEFFKEQLLPVDINLTSPLAIIPVALPKPLSVAARTYQALVLGVRDYVSKNNFPGVLIGLSGGIDSALALAVAVDALGKERVHAVMLPSRYTSKLSVEIAEQLIKNFGVQATSIDIEKTFAAVLASLQPEFAGKPENIAEENLQSRCRGMILMALSNKTGKMVLTTGNKSEYAVGYTTLYGDMAGGFAVLKDVYKTVVYELVNYRNSLQPLIPQAVIDRPPTAELKPDQTDQDTLPPYAELDRILQLYLEGNHSIAEIVAKGFAENVVRKVIKMVDLSEFKRRQSPPGPRVTTCAFGRERRYPITSGYLSN